MAELRLNIRTNINEVTKELDAKLKDRTLNLKIKVADSEMNSLLTRLEQLERSAKDTAASMNKIGKTSSGVSATKTQLNNAKSLQKAYNEILAAQSKVYAAQKKYSSTFSGRNKDNIVETDFDRNQIAKLKEYEAAYNSLLSKYRSNSFGDADYTAFKNIKAQADTTIKEVDNAKKRIEQSLSGIKLKDSKTVAFDKIGNRLTDYFNRYETSLTKNIDLYNKWLTLMNKANTGRFSSISEANREFAQFRAESRAAGIEVEGFGAKLEKTFGTRIRSALSGYGVFALETAVQDILEKSIAVDTAMTELKKVTDESDATYDQFLSNASERASQIGASLSEVVNATADYARLGYDIPDSTQLADSALIYLNVGDDVETIDDATSSLISTMQGFGIAAEDSMSIVDKFNNVSNNFAVSAGDIGEMVKRSASSMAAANNDLDETIALGTAANTVVQDADVVGTALKTMSMRLRGAKTDLESAGLDADGMASSVSTLRDEMLSLTGVDIMLDEDTFKSSYDILMGIGEVWDNLTDVNRANVLELLFGKRQGNIGAAILDNYELAQDVLETSRDSEGSAIAENEKFLDSVEGHIRQFQAKWESFSVSLANSDALKMFIDLGGGVVTVLQKMTDAFGLTGMASAPLMGSLSKIGNLGKEYALLCGGNTTHRMLAA